MELKMGAWITDPSFFSNHRKLDGIASLSRVSAPFSSALFFFLILKIKVGLFAYQLLKRLVLWQRKHLPSRICLGLPGAVMYWLRTFPKKSKLEFLPWPFIPVLKIASDKRKLSTQFKNWWCRCLWLVIDFPEVFEIYLSIQKSWWSLSMPSSQDFHMCSLLSCMSQNFVSCGSVPRELLTS